ncbi:hypothetical protein GGR55DRAFT_682901 [Xylaria sp. FL0064]|nr:hypothetical protein GGR55DRAFT_682901 [Xylaria sp. FL0064]
MITQLRRRARAPPSRCVPLRREKFKREIPLIKRIARKKANERLPKRPKNALRHRPDLMLRPGDLIIRRLRNDDEFEGMVRVFAELESTSGLAGGKPVIYSQDPDRLEILLLYPDNHFRPVIDDRILPKAPYLGLAQVRELRDTLVNDVSILCASRIAFSSDISFLRIGFSKKFLPLLDIFDLAMSPTQDVANDTTNWEELEKDLVRKIDAQFQVFEYLAQLEPLCLDPPKQYNLQLDPEYALRITQGNQLYHTERSLIFQQVCGYSREIASEVIYLLRDLIAGQSRWRLHDALLTRELNTAAHVIRQSSGAEAGTEDYIPLLVDITQIRILCARLLFAHHAKVGMGPIWLIELSNPGVAENYSSPESFELVKEAFRNAREAIESLYKAGGRLTRMQRRYISDRPWEIRKSLVDSEPL